MSYNFGELGELSVSEARCLRTFLAWPPRMRRKVAAWIATLPNHGGFLRLSPMQKAAFDHWWQKEFLRSQPQPTTPDPCSNPSSPPP